ncbi:hypothetical protein E4T50_15428 [Aureobasidium sp. EXF-12298]|nr:hypothetical protein E4T50_15428 [Aureobasidium sp. EXF-12298]KAI4754135.1 hypothetical protein E4T51_12753 [Aureobasidium sp. EXF-12344]KAI4771244.1 hypothetical protein E4T52_13760 [Aureobasidium sp. EXF-3400]
MPAPERRFEGGDRMSMGALDVVGDAAIQLAGAACETRHELTSPALLPAELTLSARGLCSLGVSTAFKSPLAVLLCLVGLYIVSVWDCDASSGVRTRLLDCDASFWSCSCGTAGIVLNPCLRSEEIADLVLEYATGPGRPGCWTEVVACASRGLRMGLTDAFRNAYQLQALVYSDLIWMVLSVSPWLGGRMVWLSRAGKQKDQFNIVAIVQPLEETRPAPLSITTRCARTIIDVRTVASARLPRPCLTSQPPSSTRTHGAISCSMNYNHWDLSAAADNTSGRPRLIWPKPQRHPIKVQPWWSTCPAGIHLKQCLVACLSALVDNDHVG